MPREVVACTTPFVRWMISWYQSQIAKRLQIVTSLWSIEILSKCAQLTTYPEILLSK